jgi:F0F1-type ATP synthase assembly protein I
MEEEQFKRFKLKKPSATDVWWRRSLFFFFDLSGYVLGPLVAAYFIGSFLDKKFAIAPWGLVFALITGFIVSIAAIITKTLKYLSEAEKVEKEEKK